MNITALMIVFGFRNYFVNIFDMLHSCLYHMFSICYIATPGARNEAVMPFLLHELVHLYMQIQIPVIKQGRTNSASGSRLQELKVPYEKIIQGDWRRMYKDANNHSRYLLNIWPRTLVATYLS